MVVSSGIVITNANHPWPLKRTTQNYIFLIEGYSMENTCNNNIIAAWWFTAGVKG